MRDVNDKIITMQLNIINQKTQKEKWLMVFSMINMGIFIVRNNI